MNLFGAQTVPLEPHEVHLAQALADVATIGILQERSVRHLSDLSTQLQAALQSRIAIEQAKGVLAERQRASMDEAFALLRAMPGAITSAWLTSPPRSSTARCQRSNCVRRVRLPPKGRAVRREEDWGRN